MYSFHPFGKLWTRHRGFKQWTSKDIWGEEAHTTSPAVEPSAEDASRGKFARGFVKSLFDAADLDHDGQITFREAILLLKNRQMLRWAIPYCLAANEWVVEQPPPNSSLLFTSGPSPANLRELDVNLLEGEHSLPGVPPASDILPPSRMSDNATGGTPR